MGGIQETYRLCQEIIYGKLTIKEHSILTTKSYRQCQRLVKKVKDKGMLVVVHGNFGNIPHNKTSFQDELNIKTLLKNDYYDFNLTHFREMILEKRRNEFWKKCYPSNCKVKWIC